MMPNLVNTLERLQLLFLEKTRERGDVIAVYRGITGWERADKKMFGGDTGSTRGHYKILKKTRCVRDTKKYSFSLPLYRHME